MAATAPPAMSKTRLVSISISRSYAYPDPANRIASSRTERKRCRRPALLCGAASATGRGPRICARMQNLPVEEEINEGRAVLGKFGMHVKFVRNPGECVQLRRNLGVAEHLQHMLAILRRNGHIRQTVENHRGRVARFDMGDGAGVTYRSFITSRRHQRLSDVLYIGLR